jgi:hypothetical protein
MGIVRVRIASKHPQIPSLFSWKSFFSEITNATIIKLALRRGMGTEDGSLPHWGGV